MRYLITGATGFIGPYLVKKLISMGHKCRCLIRPDSNLKLIDERDIELFEGDITKPETLYGLAEGVDYLLHLATLGHMSNYKVSETRFFEVNVNGTKNVMNEALRAGLNKVVHCSSVAAMGISNEIPANEKTACNPHNPYGRSKLGAENVVLDMTHNDALPAVIVRFSMVYGPGDQRDILRLTKMAKKGLVPKIGNRPKLTPLVHVDDAVEGLILATEKGRIGETYILSNSQSEPFDELIGNIKRALGKRSIQLYVPEWVALKVASIIENVSNIIGMAPPITRNNIESTLADRVFSIEKAKNELGFRPRINPVEGLKQTVEWYKEKGWV